MSIGASGRIVIEIPPDLKRELYAALARDGVNLKWWFLRQAQDYLSHGQQWRLALEADSTRALASTDCASGNATAALSPDS
jgi:hypothetical protein